MTARAICFTGEDAVPHDVEIDVRDGKLIVSGMTAEIDRIPAASLIRLKCPVGQRRVARRDRAGWRLVLEEPLDAEIDALLPSRISSGGRNIRPSSIVFAGGCAAIAIAIVGTIMFRPGLFAAAIPLGIERQLGDEIAPLKNVSLCEDPGANAALQKLLDRVDPDARKDGFTVELVYSAQPNALALPGGRMLIFTGLLETAGDSDAIAGAIAHEVAHVRRRHIAAQMVRQLGVEGVLKMVGGGGLANGATSLLSRKFSRDDEAQADSDAVAMLAAANISPRTTAGLFSSLAEADSAVSNWLSDHPSNDSREAKFRASFRKGHRYTFALSTQDEEALFSGCRIPSYY